MLPRGQEFRKDEYDEQAGVKEQPCEYQEGLNAKKEPAALLPAITDESDTLTDSKISIAWLLEIARENFPDVLPQSVLAHYGISRPGTALGRPARNTDVKTAGQKPPTLGFWMRWRA